MHAAKKKMAMRLLVVVGCLLTMSCEMTDPATTYTGTYVGTTASGGAVRIEVGGSRISAFEVSDMSLTVGICELTEVTFEGNIPISDGSFSASDEDEFAGASLTIRVEGEFVGDSVTGSITLTGTGNLACTGVASDTFTANRDT